MKAVPPPHLCAHVLRGFPRPGWGHLTPRSPSSRLPFILLLPPSHIPRSWPWGLRSRCSPAAGALGPNMRLVGTGCGESPSRCMAGCREGPPGLGLTLAQEPGRGQHHLAVEYGPEVTSPRAEEFCTHCKALGPSPLCSPSPAARLGRSLPVALCLRGSAAPGAPCRTGSSIQKAPWPCRLWALVLNMNSCGSPSRAEGSQVLTSGGGGGGWGPCGGSTLCSVCTSLGEPRRPCPVAPPTCHQATPAARPGGPACAAANTGGRVHASPSRMGNQTF